MLLSTRERPPDNISATSNTPSSIPYHRTSFTTPSPLLVVSPTSSSNISVPRRAPLAPLDPQVASTMPLDNQSSAPGSSNSSYHVYSPADATKDSERTLDSVRALIGRPIVSRPQEEELSSGPQAPRKKSLSGYNNSPRPSPYPPRSAQRRPSSTSPTVGPRRPSLPNALQSLPSPPNSSLPSPPHHPIASEQPIPPHHYNEDLYSGLSTFTFGAALPLPSPHGSDSSDMISPLTRVSGSGSADRTPRPSVSSASSGRRKSRSHRARDPDEGDDEYEDEDELARGKTRSKMRAIDDGSRRPSLPTNAHLPSVSTDSSTPVLSSSANAMELSPGGSSASESAYEDSEAEQDEGDLAEFDTDVELDLPHGHGAARRHDPPVSDTASQHTFGAGSFDHYGSDQFGLDDGASILSDGEEGIAISPVTFTRDRDDENFDDGDRPLPSLPPQAGKKSGLPWEVPSLPVRDSVAGLNRDREDSAATVTARRASRSVDDDLTASTMYPDVQLPSHPQLKLDLNSDGSVANTAADEQEFQYGEYNIDYILGHDSVSRRSWSSGAPSYIQTRRVDSGDPSALGAMWDAAIGGSRRPSTATVNSGDDAFARQVRSWDPEYTSRKSDWTFKKESTDGRGPHRMPLPSTSPAETSQHTMQPGTQEIWRQAYVGRYKVDRVKMTPDQPAKAPQQRLNVRHIHDPYSKGNTQAGPGSVIHKHSRAIAFSIFRNHSLFSKHHRQHKQPMHTSISILLANKKVQEQYTSTRTTSKLNSHGLLEDVGTMGTTSAYSQSRTMIATVSTRSRPSTPHPTDGSQSEGYASDQRGQSSARSSSMPRELPLPPSTTSPISLRRAPSSNNISSSSAGTSQTARVSGESMSSNEPGTSTDRSSLSSQSSTAHTITRQNPDEVDEDDSPPRTSHAEAFATVDSSYLEHMRARPERRHPEEPVSHGLVGVLRRKLLGSGKSVPKVQSVHPPSVPRDGNYTPPWLTMAPRSKQEERERVIQNLNDSFKDVGLLPTARANKGGNKSRRPRHPNTTTIFEKVPADSLYMLLPLWPGETDPTFSEAREDPASYFVPVEERQYLLVYYVPFDDKSKLQDKKADANKKRSRADTRSIVTASSTTMTERVISLRSFKAVARLVSYTDLRETGVRVPAFGLSITGSLSEATQLLPPPSIREQRLDDIVIGVCYNRVGGVEFIPEGLQKLGLCMPTEKPPKPPSNDMDDEQEEEVILTPIGRAAIEMAWLGCMAVASFGST